MEIVPAVNQVETHVFDQQREPQRIMEEFGTRIMSWGPLAEGRNGFFTNPVLAEIGSKYGKSVAQVALRWLIQRGVVIIPKSTHIERMRQNLDIFDFTLSDEDMAAIAALDTGKSLFFDHHDAETTVCSWDGGNATNERAVVHSFQCVSRYQFVCRFSAAYTVEGSLTETPE